MSNTPFVSKRAPIYQDVPAEQWNNWRWQLSNRLNTVEDFEKVLHLTDSERKALNAPGVFRVDITPYFVSLINPDDPNDPVRKQVVPTAAEMVPFTAMMEDSLSEDRHSPVPGLVHRYPDRVLMLVTTQCASYCRYCTRSRIVGDPSATFSRAEFEMQIEYLKRTPQVRDVLLSGGDPLVLAPRILEEILSRLREIPHIEIVRIGSRVPVFLPMRVTTELTDMLQKYHPLWLNIHVNHPNEISSELAEACDRLTRAGVPLGNQSVLMAGINDNVHIQRQLVHDLVRIRVRPYYLYQCDLVEGAGHFRTPVAKGDGNYGGAARPYLRLRCPHVCDRCARRRRQNTGHPKLPAEHVGPQIILRNFEGTLPHTKNPLITTPAMPPRLLVAGPNQDRRAISGLLDGNQMFIKPEGFDDLHDRGGIQHRLKDAKKWVPLGIGPGQGQEEKPEG